MIAPCLRSLRSRIVLAAAAVALAGAVSGRADEPPAQPVLHLRNGGYVPGTLVDSPQPATLRWQAAAFVDPFEFDMSAVNAVHFRSDVALAKRPGTHAFELAGGDSLIGTLVALDERQAVIDVPRVGRHALLRTAIQRIDFLRAGSELLYAGPIGLIGWKQAETGPQWREDAGQLMADRPGATVQGDFGLPPRALVEFQFSWRDKPDFVFVVGTDRNDATTRHAFRFEIWETALVVHRETESEAEVASVQEIGAGAGRTHLLAFLDQEKGRIVVVSPAGKTLADLSLPDKDQRPFSGLRLVNNEGSVRLERLRISRWISALPVGGARETPGIQLADGTAVEGKVVRFDADAKEFVVRHAGSESTVPEDKVASLRMWGLGDASPRPLAVSTVDGARLSGALKSVGDGAVVLEVPSFDKEIRVPIADLRSLALRRDDTKPPPDDELIRLLESDGLRLFGSLAPAEGKPGTQGLAWKPTGSRTSSRFVAGTSGQFVSNWWERKPDDGHGHDPAFANVTQQGFRVVDGRLVPLTPPRLGGLPVQPGRYVYLKAGDCVPGEVTKIDDEGAWVQSPFSEASLIPHDKMKAADLARELPGAARLSKAKRDRLLTLPRLQKDSPPTHIVVSTAGDYLRGRLVSMDEKTVKLEVRLEVKELPRDGVARIIWLHPEPRPASSEKTDAKPAAKPKVADANAPWLVQAVCRGGIRLTFAPDRVEGATLFGKSDVLGSCRVELKTIEEMLLGKAIENETSGAAFRQWVLRDAVEPLVITTNDGSAPTVRNPGTSSLLVGKPAPDFELDLLGGETFHLAANKGKVVVLDFWATWCGPCLQAMPQVEQVTREFRDRDVRLIAVNLQETPKQISDLLERRKLDLTVALDREGRVAEKYKAKAIPQTVIIDRTGTIARLFVGSSPHLSDDLREALTAVLDGTPKDSPVKKAD